MAPPNPPTSHVAPCPTWPSVVLVQRDAVLTYLCPTCDVPPGTTLAGLTTLIGKLNLERVERLARLRYLPKCHGQPGHTIVPLRLVITSGPRLETELQTSIGPLPPSLPLAIKSYKQHRCPVHDEIFDAIVKLFGRDLGQVFHQGDARALGEGSEEPWRRGSREGEPAREAMATTISRVPREIRRDWDPDHKRVQHQLVIESGLPLMALVFTQECVKTLRQLERFVPGARRRVIAGTLPVGAFIQAGGKQPPARGTMPADELQSVIYTPPVQRPYLPGVPNLSKPCEGWSTGHGPTIVRELMGWLVLSWYLDLFGHDPTVKKLKKLGLEGAMAVLLGNAVPGCHIASARRIRILGDLAVIQHVVHHTTAFLPEARSAGALLEALRELGYPRLDGLAAGGDANYQIETLFRAIASDLERVVHIRAEWKPLFDARLKHPRKSAA